MVGIFTSPRAYVIQLLSPSFYSAEDDVSMITRLSGRAGTEVGSLLPVPGRGVPFS